VPPTLADRLIHILRAIDNIQDMLAGKTKEQFAADIVMCLAIERAFEIISEASRRISGEVKAKQQQIDWRGIADLGNTLRHAYHRVNVEKLWDIAQRDLPPLKAFAEEVLREEEA
jgi:uncharacterized protein with HEPN domain